MITLRAPSVALVSLLCASFVTASFTPSAHAQSTGSARIVVESTKPDVEVSMQSAAALGTTSGGAVLALRVSQEMCVAPCAFNIQPGRHTIVFRRDGSPTEFYSGIVRPGETRFTVKPGVSAPHGIGYVLGFFGVVAVITGGVLWGVGSSTGGKTDGPANAGKYTTLGGLAGLAAGIPLVLLTGTNVDVKQPEPGQGASPAAPGTPPGLRSASRVLGLGYATAF